MTSKPPFDLGAMTPEPLRKTMFEQPQEVVQGAQPTQTLMADVQLVTEGQPEADGVWFPVDLPSMGLARYPAQIKVRKFGLPDLASLGAARKANSYSLLVAAVGSTLYGVDVNMLTHGDFDYIMYWHTTMSITKAPLTVTWRSRYGFDNKTQVTKQMRKSVFIENAQAVREMQAKGYDFSRVGDELWRLHAKDIGAFDDRMEVLFSLATWVKVDDPLNFDSKLAAINNMKDSLAFYEELDAWREVANHGVEDRALLTCAHFKPETAISRISQQLALLDANVATGAEFDEYAQQLVTSLLQELAELRKLEADGKLSEAKPKEEEIVIPLDVTNFFPVVL